MTFRPENQQVWVKPPGHLGRIIDHFYRGGQLFYRVAVPMKDAPPRVYRVPRQDLRTADKFCDGCQKWLPLGSFNGGGQYNNPIDGVVEVEYCFLCTRESRQKGWY